MPSDGETVAKALSRWRKIDAPNGTMADADLYPGCFVLVSCNACGHFKSYHPATVVLRLRQLQMGGTLATLAEVAGRVEVTCPCGVRDWRAELAFRPGTTDGDIKSLAARARN